MSLSQKCAVVTGAASGFGAAIAERFAHEGARVVLADIDVQKAQEVADRILQRGGKVSVERCNVAMEESWQEMVARTISRFGSLDVLVNNAGATHRNQPALEVSEADFDRIYAVNVKSIFWSARAILPMWRERRSGVMINVASTTAVRPGPGLTWYSATKAAVINITRGLALEFASFGIRVNAINPMLGETGLLTEFMGRKDTPGNRGLFLARVPLGRLTRPEDVANAAAFLARSEADYLTGVCLDVDGGRSI